MKTGEKVFPVITIVMMLTTIALCVLNKNIEGVLGWTVGFLGYLVHLKDEAEYEKLIKELKDVYEVLRKSENK